MLLVQKRHPFRHFGRSRPLKPPVGSNHRPAHSRELCTAKKYSRSVLISTVEFAVSAQQFEQVSETINMLLGKRKKERNFQLSKT